MNTRYALWALLALPSIPLLIDFVFDERYYSELMYESGVLSVQFFVLTLCITPFRYLTQGIAFIKPLNRWLIKSRRYFGVACFAYGLIHLLVYLREYPDLVDIIAQMAELEIALGWIAMLILTALAVTSNDRSVRALGHRWRTLHQLAYPTVALLYFHWYLFGFFLQVLQYWFVPLIAFQIYRVVRQVIKKRNSVPLSGQTSA